MVRTRAGPSKVSAGKAPSKQRAIAALDNRGSPSRNKLKDTSGNPYHPRETPGWQKPIKSFFQTGTPSNSITEGVQDIDLQNTSTIPSSEIVLEQEDKENKLST